MDSEDAAPTRSPGRPVAKDLPAGTEVDARFTIVERIGAGGMGVVYRADDTQLARSVALKIVPLQEREIDRAMREARTMAQLSHPNVVAVHDVGLLDEDHLYIAMEFVRGPTVRRWLTAHPRSPAEILQLYLQAAQGLIAAHDAGLVHRDFKPDNVLVGEDGRPRITDFGLARSRVGQADTTLSGEALHATGGHASDRGTTLTSPSAFAGTPAYMSPEQREGRSADARTDQFAFCVSLWEALYGQPPFPAGELDASVTPTPPRGKGRARRVEAALRRGLSFFPDDRFASMTELAEALERPARRARRRGIAVAGVAAATAMMAAGFSFAGMQRASSCEAGSDAAGQIWSDERRQAFRERLGAMDPDYGVAAAVSFVENVSRWASGWSQHYEEACLDASDTDHGLRGARLRCLDDQLIQVDTLLTEIEAFESSSGSLGRIEAFAYTLPNPRDCSRPEYLAGRLGSGDEMTEELVAIIADMRRLDGYEDVGDVTRGIPLAESLLERTEKGGYPSARGDVFFHLGALRMQTGEFELAEQMLTEAFFESRAANNDHGAAAVAIKLIWVVGMYQGRYRDARVWARHAEAAVTHRDASPQVTADLTCTLGVLSEYEGNYDEALRLGKRCVPLMADAFGEKHPHVALALNDLGSALDASGQLDEARDAYDRALAIRREAIKTPDQMLSIILSNRALVEQQQGNLEAAVRDQREAVRVISSLVPDDSAQLVIPLTNLAGVLNQVGQFDEAIVHLERARALGRTHFGAEHPDMVYVHAALGEAYLLAERPEAARAELELALSIAAKAEAFEAGTLEQIRENLATLDTGAQPTESRPADAG